MNIGQLRVRNRGSQDYTQVISLEQMLQPEVIAVYNQRATGTKVLVNPSLGLGG